MKIPTSPEEMPREWGNSERSVRNCLVTLNEFDHVELTWEKDVDATRKEGEIEGEWIVEITTCRKRFTARHPNITNALWFAATLAEAADTADFEAREKARADALAKLTPDERKLLGLA